MNKTYISLIVFILVVLGIVFLVTNSKKVEAPQVEVSETVNNAPTTDKEQSDQLGIIVETNIAPVKEFTISGKNFSFTPSSITVKKGDRVKITFNNTDGFHDFVLDEYGVATKQAKAPASEVLEFTADKVGSFEYYCSVGSHRAMGMKGTLKVE